MRFNCRFFFTFLTLFFTFYANKGSNVYGLPIPQPTAPLLMATVPRSSSSQIQSSSTNFEEKDDSILALRDFMENVQQVGGSAYSRALYRRKLGSSDDVASVSSTAAAAASPPPPSTLAKAPVDVTQLKSSSSGFLFLPLAGPSAPSNPSTAKDGKGDTVAPIRQTMFFNIEAPNGGQLTRVDVPALTFPPSKDGSKKDGEYDDDDKKKEESKMEEAIAMGKASKEQTGKGEGQPPTQGQTQGKGKGQGQAVASAKDADVGQKQGGGASTEDDKSTTSDQIQAANLQNQDQSQIKNTDQDQGQAQWPDQSKSAKQDTNLTGDNQGAGAKTGTSAPSTAVSGDSADLAGAGGQGTDGNVKDPSESSPAKDSGVTAGINAAATAKTQLKDPNDSDGTSKTKIVFKPLVDPESTSTPQANSNSPSKTSAAADNVDDKKPDPKATVGGQDGTNGAAQKAMDGKGGGATATNSKGSVSSGSIGNDPAFTSPPSPPAASQAKAATDSPIPAPSTNSTANASTADEKGSNPKDYFIYPVEKDHKVVDLNQGDMVAYVDKGGNLAGDTTSQAVGKMLKDAGDTAPPPTASNNTPPSTTPPSTTPPSTTPPSPTAPQPVKRTHPRMWTLMRRAPVEGEKSGKKSPTEESKKKEKKHSKATGKKFDMYPGKKNSRIGYYHGPA